MQPMQIGSFDINQWVDFIGASADTGNSPDESPYVCRAIYPDNTRCLQMMTPTEVNNFLQTHGRWSANCVKMQFVDIIRITRICLARGSNTQQKQRMITALNLMAAKAEAKYKSNWIGTVRKVFSCICNIFKEAQVTLFHDVTLSVPHMHDNIPFFVGSDASFARLVAKSYLTINRSPD